MLIKANYLLNVPISIDIGNYFFLNYLSLHTYTKYLYLNCVPNV